MRDVEKLLEDYKPLILSVYKRLHPMFSNKEDKEDLMSQIRLLFVNLVCEYDPRRGVDFPFYIKRMLELRAYHYVTKQLQPKNKEVLTQSFTNDEVSYGIPSGRDDFEDIINLESWDDNFTLGKKQKRLFIGLLIEHKSLKELADEEGIDVSILHTRLHFLIKKLRHQSEIQSLLEKKLEGAGE
jgi:RNA polymerase sigma factor (sigma-70 family)